MAEIVLKCTGQELDIVEEETIASGGINSVIVSISFSEEWDGLVKTLVAYQNAKKGVYHQVMEDDQAVVPWEALADKGRLYLGVFGINGDVNLPSTIVKLKVEAGSISVEPTEEQFTESFYEQVLKLYHIGDNGNWWVGDLDTGVAATGPQGVSGVWIGTDTPPDGYDVWLNTAEDPFEPYEGETTDIYDEYSGEMEDIEE